MERYPTDKEGHRVHQLYKPLERAPEPVELPHYQLIVHPTELRRGTHLWPVCLMKWELLLEDLLAAGRQ